MKTTKNIEAEALVQEVLELYGKLSKENQEKFLAMLKEAYHHEMVERQQKGMEA